MLNGEILSLIIASSITGGVIGSIMVGFPMLKKKGVNVERVFNTTEEVLDVAAPAIKLAQKIAPNNTIVNIADFIEKWAKTGVKNAQQLYHASQLPNNEDRKGLAKSTVYAALKELNIEPTENQKKLIDDTIEAAVNDLGHKEKSEAEKEVEKQKLLQEKQKVEDENTELKEKMTQIQNTVSTTQVAQ